jgi:DNA polymerase III delta subunit
MFCDEKKWSALFVSFFFVLAGSDWRGGFSFLHIDSTLLEEKKKKTFGAPEKGKKKKHDKKLTCFRILTPFVFSFVTTTPIFLFSNFKKNTNSFLCAQAENFFVFANREESEERKNRFFVWCACCIFTLVAQDGFALCLCFFLFCSTHDGVQTRH